MAGNSKQWAFVGVIVAGLALGAWTLVRFAPIPEGAEVGNRAPDFRAVDLASGDTVSFRERYDGYVTLVNIWATWCAPCRAEMPAMQGLYDLLKDKGFRIAAVSIDEGSAQDVMAFANELNLTFDILHDKSGSIEQIYRTTGVPESFLVDRNGTIIRKQLGEHPWNSPANQRIVAQLLGVDLPPDPPPTASESELDRGPR
jgi:cytochrome c biogenesis protein CcmG, thiol:disulfide interchange protein DsbE